MTYTCYSWVGMGNGGLRAVAENGCRATGASTAGMFIRVSISGRLLPCFLCRKQATLVRLVIF